MAEVIDSEMVYLVEVTAEARNDAPVPRNFIVEAMQRIKNGEEDDINYYPTGAPSLKNVYEVAARLYSECTS